MQYRKKYKVDEETYENLKVYEKLKLHVALKFLKYIIYLAEIFHKTF